MKRVLLVCSILTMSLQVVLAQAGWEWGEQEDKAKEKDLIIYDRGYGATWFFYYMFTKKINYIIRL